MEIDRFDPHQNIHLQQFYENRFYFQSGNPLPVFVGNVVADVIKTSTVNKNPPILTSRYHKHGGAALTDWSAQLSTITIFATGKPYQTESSICITV
jgi:hypothetical protein